MVDARPSTPPPSTRATSVSPAKPPLTPQQLRKIEENRLRAKAIYEARQAEQKAAAGNKRPAPAPVTPVRSTRQKTLRNASQSPNDPNNQSKAGGATSVPAMPQAARKFANFVEYDFSKMSDTKGGFLADTDDPFAGLDLSSKPANMSIEAWQRVLLKEKLAAEKKEAFRPGITLLDVKQNDEDGEEVLRCFECESLEIDWQMWEGFKSRVCKVCREKLPEKYSLLTKTECKEDYLLTDPELRDTELIPHIKKPNPHKSTWNDMMLYVRYQVEEVAFKKWGSPEALDAEFERRTAEKKRKNEEKFKKRLRELKNKTRVETWKRKGGRQDEGKHVHSWGPEVSRGDMVVKTCESCGMEMEEIVFGV